MEKLSVKKLIENRFILFMPIFYIYLSVVLLIIPSLDLTISRWQAVMCFSWIPVAVIQGKTTYDYRGYKNTDRDIYVLSWILTILGIVSMGLVYLVKVVN